MDLLDRYLRAVEFWLSDAQRADVIDELSDDLHSQIDEAQTTLGRPLNDDEIAAILKRTGHPIVVAGRYLPQQYLIGPVLAPIYRLVLRIVMLWVLVPVLVLIVAPIAVLGGTAPLEALGATLFALIKAELFAFAIITLVFAQIERSGWSARSIERWDPRRLPVFPVRRSERRGPSVYGAVVTLACRVVFTVWWLLLLRSQTIYADASVTLSFTPIWHALYWPILFLSLLGIATDIVNVYRPDWQPLGFVRLAGAVASLLVIYILLRGGPWIDVAAPGVAAAQLATATWWANVSTAATIAGTGITILIEAFAGVRRLRTMASVPAL